MFENIMRASNSIGQTMTTLIVAARVGADIEGGRQPAEEDLKMLGFPANLGQMD